MSLRSRLMARYYDATMRSMEAVTFARWRRDLLRPLKGSVLEIGSGTGINLSWYGPGITRLVLTEPDPHMRRQLEPKTQRWGGGGICSVEDAPGEKVPHPSGSFDVVVSTLVLCSVRSQAETLSEVRRLLKPGGRLVFLEHVRASGPPRLVRWQRWLQPFWVRVSGNCHLTRNTEQAILDAGFEFLQIDRTRSRGGPAIVSPTIKGIAIRTA